MKKTFFKERAYLITQQYIQTCEHGHIANQYAALLLSYFLAINAPFFDRFINHT